MVIKVDYKKNADVMEDFYRVLTRATQRKKTIAVRVFYGIFGTLGLSAGGVLLFAGENRAMAVLGLIAGVYFMVRCVFFYKLFGIAAKRAMQVESALYCFDEDEEELSIDDELEHCTHPYAVFRGAYESRRIFLILLTARTGYVIPKADLSSVDEMEVRRILKEEFPAGLTYYDI